MTKHYACTEAQFLSDVATHEMTVIRDDASGRHLRFKKPGSGSYWFDILTWQNSLCIDGDMGTHVFRRVEDMFDFFRVDAKDWSFNKEGGLSINPSYWAEKLRIDSGGGHKEFDEDAFHKMVSSYALEWVRSHRDQTTRIERRDLWDHVVGEIFEADSPDRKEIAAYDFRHDFSRTGLSFSFEDALGSSYKKFTFHYIWCCYAIAWAIKKYDESKLLMPADEVFA